MKQRLANEDLTLKIKGILSFIVGIIIKEEYVDV